jgi:hypothetical protein
MKKIEKIFILGDSRTGTTYLHDFLTKLGYNSIHYYVNEASMLEHTPVNYKENERRIVKFAYESKFNVFSDYPTRLYYPILSAFFPNACFILSHRESTDRWEKSIITYATLKNITLNIDECSYAYEKINQDIRNHFYKHPFFFEVCIDLVEKDLINLKLLKLLNHSADNINFDKINSSEDFLSSLIKGDEDGS